jgi:PAS domain S-box-containing protein
MNPLKRPSTKTQLQFIVPSVVAIAAFVVSLFGFFLPRVRNIGIDQKKEAIRELVQLPVQICAWHQAKAERGEMTLPRAKREAASVIRELRYGAESKDYFWVLDTTPVLIMHPYRLDLEGQNVADYEDLDGVRVFMEMTEEIRQSGEGYVSYRWQVRDEAGVVERKLSYVSSFAPWNWIIGTGMYVGEVERQLAAVSRSMMFVSLAVTVFVAFLLLFISRKGLSEQAEKTKAAMELARSEDRYSRLIRLMHEGVIAADVKGRITFVNRQFCEMLGYSGEELLGKQISDFVTEESKETFLSEMEKRKAGKAPIYTTEWRKRDGGSIAAVASPRILYNAEGNQAGSFAVITDVSDLKRAEEELRDLLQEKTVMLKEIHHRVKNNLQLISSLFSLQYRNISDDRSRDLLYDSQSRIQTMSRIHESLYQSDNFKDIQMEGFLEQLVFDIKSVYLDADSNQFNFVIDADPAALPVDRAVPCGLIMNELASNAVKHAFPPEYIDIPEKKIIIFLHEHDDCIRFGVEDNGRGLPAEIQTAGGTTLGLELITVLTEQLGGKMSFAESASGGGSRVEVCIPYQSGGKTVLYAVE